MGQHLAIIPARGGSKRLPRKNIALVCGKPVLAYTVEAARECGLFAQIIVSTDDQEIADVAHEAGAEVQMRAAALAGDTVTVDEVCCDVLATLDGQGSGPYEYFCCLYATGALRVAEDIAGAFALLEPGKCDFVMACREYESNPFQALRQEPDGKLTPMWPELLQVRRQDRPRVVVDAGSIYWVSARHFLEAKSFYGSNLRGFPIPPERAVDLDVPADLELMEYYMSKRSGAQAD